MCYVADGRKTQRGVCLAAGEFSRKHQESIKRSSKCVSQCIKQYHVVSYGIHTVSACIMQILFDVSQKYHILYHIRITCVSHTIRYRSDSTRYIYDTFDIMMIHTVGYGVFTVSYPLDTFTIHKRYTYDTLSVVYLLSLLSLKASLPAQMKDPKGSHSNVSYHIANLHDTTLIR